MTLQHRSEILFVYEVVDANPNGDPLDENKPRIDADTGVATVTDVRIKRTIRDYWHTRRNLEILIRDTHTDDGYLKDGKTRSADFKKKAKVTDKDTMGQTEEKIQTVILNECIDVRVFGCMLPVNGPKGKDGSVALTGPVQFSGFNRSYHRVAPVIVQGTAAFASAKEMTQKSFREDRLLPYACVGVYGVVNELAARTTGMTEDDRALVLEGLWCGTKDLISRSKMGHAPLLLLHVIYKDGYRIGDLARRVRLVSETQSPAIRSTRDFTLDWSELRKDLEAANGLIERIEWKHDGRLKLDPGGFGNNWKALDLASPGK